MKTRINLDFANCAWCGRTLPDEAAGRGAISCGDAECQRQINIAIAEMVGTICPDNESKGRGVDTRGKEKEI